MRFFYLLHYKISMRICQYSNPKNCDNLWKFFYNAFAYKEPCNVKPEDYLLFITAANHDVQTQDRVRFWIGVCII